MVARSAFAGNSQNALRVWLKTVRQAAMTPYAASQPEHVRAVLRAEAQNSWAWERRVQRCANRTSRGGARDRWGAERRGDHAQGGSDGGRGWVPSDTGSASLETYLHRVQHPPRRSHRNSQNNAGDRKSTR